ncbi:hypothetical protein NKH77_26230 [Streptomyces sp. M19]
MTGGRPAALAALGLTAALTLTGCGDGGDGDAKSDGPRLSVSGAYLPRPPMTDMAAGYLTVTNTGARPTG